MLSLRKHLRTATAVGMILLTVFSGFTGAACYCADGHLKFFCSCHSCHSDNASRGQHFMAECGSDHGAAHKAAPASCCRGKHDDRAAGAAYAGAAYDCCRGASEKPGGKTCEPAPTMVATAVAGVSMPTLDLQDFAVLPLDVLAPSRAIVSLRNAQLARVESAPPADLVITLRCLLI